MSHLLTLVLIGLPAKGQARLHASARLNAG
jgi:hypothetical protein